MGIVLKFSTTCHPQTHGQTELSKKTLDTLLRVPVKRSTKGWDELLPYAEFAYNRTPSKGAVMSPFQIVYGFNPLTPLDLVLIHTPIEFN